LHLAAFALSAQLKCNLAEQRAHKGANNGATECKALAEQQIRHLVRGAGKNERKSPDKCWHLIEILELRMQFVTIFWLCLDSATNLLELSSYFGDKQPGPQKVLNANTTRFRFALGCEMIALGAVLTRICICVPVWTPKIN